MLQVGSRVKTGEGAQRQPRVGDQGTGERRQLIPTPTAQGVNSNRETGGDGSFYDATCENTLVSQ